MRAERKGKLAAPAWQAFPINVYEEEHHLDVALEVAGHGIDDITAVVMGGVAPGLFALLVQSAYVTEHDLGFPAEADRQGGHETWRVIG
jgi:hypothetical protein